MLDLARVEGVGVVERPMAASKARRGGDRALDVGVGPLDHSFDAQPLGQARSNRRGESAAGPMSMAGRGGAGNQQVLQPVERGGIDQPGAALGDHDRVDHDRDAAGSLAQNRGDGFDDRQIVQHAGLDRIGADVVEHDLDLPPNKLGWDRQNPEYALGVLRSQRGYRGGGVGVEHRHGLNVGLDAGAAAGIGTGDDQHPAVHGYSAACAEPSDAIRGLLSSMPATASRIASQISSTIAATSSSSSPSAMTRITGSVPDLRITRRPAAPSRSLPSSMARLTGIDASGSPSANRTLRSRCGTGVNRRQTSLARRPVSTIEASTWRAAIKPSPVVA